MVTACSLAAAGASLIKKWEGCAKLRADGVPFPDT